jgi:hypothetical protein
MDNRKHKSLRVDSKNENPFDKLGLLEINLPGGMFAGFKLKEVRDFVRRWNVDVQKVDGEWKLTTDNPANFFWLGCNANNHQKESPNNFTKWVQIGDNN